MPTSLTDGPGGDAWNHEGPLGFWLQELSGGLAPRCVRAPWGEGAGQFQRVPFLRDLLWVLGFLRALLLGTFWVFWDTEQSLQGVARSCPPVSPVRDPSQSHGGRYRR